MQTTKKRKKYTYTLCAERACDKILIHKMFSETQANIKLLANNELI